MTKSAIAVELSLRERVLEAAVQEFGDKGFDGARMEEIAKVAQASKQAIYHHYQGKEGLFVEAMKLAYARFRGSDDCLHNKIAGLDAKASLRVFVEHLFRPTLHTVRFQQMMHDENRFEGTHAMALVDAKHSYRQLIEILKSILAKGAQEGVFRSDIDVKALYLVFAGTFMLQITNAHTLSAMLEIDLKTRESAERLRDLAFEIVLNSLAPR